MKMPRNRIGLAIFLVFFLSGHLAKALSPNGDWRISGTLTDIRFNMSGTARTNTLSVGGVCQGDEFLVTVTPIDTEDEIAEAVGWDGQKLRLVQRYPGTPGKGMARDQILGYVEPSVFSRYATHSTAGVLLALAGGKSLAYLQALEEPVILGDLRAFPEEDNKYEVKISPDGSVNIVAQSPGSEVTPSGNVRVTGFMDGFTRWVFASNLVPFSGQGEFQQRFDYKRFSPVNGRLFLYRQVRGDLKLEAAGHVQSNFQPEIHEASVIVRDFSSRRELHPFIKGFSDYFFGYILTNRAWDFDEEIIKSEIKNVKVALMAKGLPKQRLANSFGGSTRRPFIVVTLVIFSLGFVCGLLWLGRSQAKGIKEKQN